MIEKKEIDEILDVKNNSLNISKPLIQAIGLDAAIVYSYLISKYYEKNFIKGNFFLCTVDDIEKDLGYTAFKQRGILQQLETKNLIKLKYGQARTRYIAINEDLKILEDLVFMQKLIGMRDHFYSFMERNQEMLSFLSKWQDDSKYRTIKKFKTDLDSYNWVHKALEFQDSLETISNRELVKR